MRHVILTSCMLFLVLNGCVPHDSTIPASSSIDLPNHFYNKDPQNIVKIISTFRWWEKFHNPSLNLIMEKAFQGNFDLEIAYSRLKQAQAVNEKARAALWPSVDFEASAGRSRHKTGTSTSASTTYKAGLAASYEIDLWRKIASSHKASQFELKATEADLQAAFLTVSAQVAEAFFKAVAAKEKIALTKEIIKSYQRSADLVETRYLNGVVSALDLYQSRQNLLGAEADLPVLEGELETALNALAALTGSFPPMSELKGVNALDEPDFSFAKGMPSDLLMNRPDLKAAFLRIKALDARVAEAVAERFPSFNLLGNIWLEEQDLSRLFDFSAILWSVMASAAQPLFDAGRRKAEVELKMAELKEAVARYRQAVIEAFKEVENSLSAIKSADENHRLLKQRLQAAESSLRMALENYRSGVDTFLPVLEAQSTHARVLIGMVEAKQQRISSRIQLARALGGSWMQAVMQKRFKNE